MRIVFVAHDVPDSYGGPIVNMQRLLPALAERDVQVRALILSHRDDSPLAHALLRRGIACRTLRWQYDTLAHLTWMARQLEDWDPDVFVPNVSVAGYYLSRWVREAGRPTIGVHRCDEPYYWALVERFVSGDPRWRLTGMVTVSEEIRRRATAEAPAAFPLCTIPSGVPVPPNRSAAHRPFRIVYIGRLKRQRKRIDRVTQIVCRALRQLPDATATFIGTGPDEAFVRTEIGRYGVSGRVELAGGIDPDELPSRLEGAACVVLFSEREGTPGALMDAMACGVVPVTTSVPGGVCDLVQDGTTGIVVPDDVAAAVRAICRLHDDAALWDRLSRTARERVAAEFSLPVAAQRWIDFCSRLQQACGPPTPLRFPRRFRLPAPHPDFGKEDPRRAPLWRRAVRRIGRRVVGSLAKTARNASPGQDALPAGSSLREHIT